MEKKRFPADALHIDIPLGNEPIFATRNNDGVVIYFTGIELLTSLLKTVGGSLLVGDGDIPVQAEPPTRNQVLEILGIQDISGLNTGDQNLTPLNEAIQSLIDDLSNKADLVDDKIPVIQIPVLDEENLPVTPINIDHFVQPVGGVMDINLSWLNQLIDDRADVRIDVAGSGLPRAQPPTNFITDDEADTADFTLSPDEPNIQNYEYRILSGSITDVSVKPIPAGNLNIPANQFMIRASAIAGVRRASEWLYNTVPFTVHNVNPGNFADVIAPLTNQDVDVTGTLYSFPLGREGIGATVSQEFIPAGGIGVIRAKVNPLKSSGILALSAGDNIQGRGDLLAGIAYNRVSDTEGRFYTTASGTGTDNFDTTQWDQIPEFQVRATGTELIPEKSYDGGATWLITAGTPYIPQPNENIHFKSFFDTENTEFNSTKQVGMDT